MSTDDDSQPHLADDYLLVHGVADWEFSWAALVEWLDSRGFIVHPALLGRWSNGLSRMTSRVHPDILWMPRENRVVAPHRFGEDRLRSCMFDGVSRYTGSRMEDHASGYLGQWSRRRDPDTQ
ncbi:hypothetical protein [Gordonia soli]|uniref:Uncharacterized protein n=1 Tax=Gordonia soli NBRC 108243 TaxID=1223545 RepID=M0QM30_9ACTN|nr:hypothetical protein [Gordonia soli]GAC69469.1 hypothetical protein GS4_25_00400 [Gordonia soli NBRC 108243]